MKFQEAGKNTSYLKQLLQRSQDSGVVNHLIMVDGEGPLSRPKDQERLMAVENHKKWIEAAKFLGCKTVRVNLHGEGNAQDKKSASIDSLGRLGEFGKSMEINIVVENHGNESSDAAWIVDIMRQVNLSNVGTLPDFGNFCLTHPWGSTQEGCEIRTRAYRVDVVDTTGAGDAFRGGLAAAWVRLDAAAPLEDILRYANATAALNCRAVGAQTALPTWAEVEGLVTKGGG